MMRRHLIIITDLTHHFTLLIVFKKRRTKTFEPVKMMCLSTEKESKNGITFNNFTVVSN